MRRITFYSAVAVIAAVCFFIVIAGGDDCDDCYTLPVMSAKFMLSGLVIIVGSIYFRKKYLETEGLIFDIESEPLLETNEATSDVSFAGEGVIEAIDGNVLTSAYTGKPCVYYHCIKEKLVRQGKSSHWETVENISRFICFHIKDERGSLDVDPVDMDEDFSSYKIPGQNMRDPENSEIDCDVALRNSGYTESGSGFLSSLVRTKYRKSEFILSPGTKVFVYGQVFDVNGEKVLRESERCPLIISKKNRDEYVHEFYQGGNLVFLAPALMMIGFSVMLFASNYFFRMKSFSFFVILLAGNFIVALNAVFSLYNRMIGLKQRALNSLSNIDIELKRRSDLVPNLVGVVRGYAKHEEEVQSIVSQMRAGAVFTKEYRKSSKISIPTLAAVVENYPDLKASENFLSLMTALVDVEERIAYAREFYNRSVKKYNTAIRMFPFVIVSSPLGMKEMDFLSIDRSVQNSPQV
ncbi:MAG: LemA family protein [Candidatus Paceibacterota bacterium]